MCDDLVVREIAMFESASTSAFGDPSTLAMYNLLAPLQALPHESVQCPCARAVIVAKLCKHVNRHLSL